MDIGQAQLTPISMDIDTQAQLPPISMDIDTQAQSISMDIDQAQSPTVDWSKVKLRFWFNNDVLLSIPSVALYRERTTKATDKMDF
jgi:hypothetical protein